MKHQCSFKLNTKDYVKIWPHTPCDKYEWIQSLHLIWNMHTFSFKTKDHWAIVYNVCPCLGSKSIISRILGYVGTLESQLCDAHFQNQNDNV